MKLESGYTNMTFLATKTKSALNVPSERDREYSEVSKFYYDYSSLQDKNLEKWLLNCTIEIRGRVYKSLKEIYKIGNLLSEVKERIGWGNYREWLKKEFIDTNIFGVSTAENYQALASAVDKYGFDKLKYFSVSAVYIAGKARDYVDEEFQQYIFDEGANKYINTGKPIGRQEVLDEKKRFKLIKESSLTTEQKKEVLEAKIPIEVLSQIIKYPEADVQQSLANKVLGKVVDVDVKIPEEVTKEKSDQKHKSPTSINTKATELAYDDLLTNIKYFDYKGSSNLLSSIDTTKVFEVALVQHSIDREGGDINEVLSQLGQVSNTIITITLPMDIFSLQIPVGFTLKNLIYARRKHHRLWNDLSMISHLVCLSVIGKNSSRPKKSLDDYFESIDYAIETVINAYNHDTTNSIYFTRTDSNVVSYDVFTKNLLTKLSQTIINPMLVCK